MARHLGPGEEDNFDFFSSSSLITQFNQMSAGLKLAAFVIGIVALIVATLHVMRPSIVTLTVGLVAAGLGIVLYNIVLSGLAIGLLILGFARPAPATA